MKKKKSTLLIVSMSFLLSIGTLMFSSCADKDDPSPILPIPEDTPYILKLKFSEKVEFKEILNKNDIQDLTETETAYFGERIQWSCPHELQFDRDSLSIVKTNNIVEKYKLKWQDKKLFIYQKPIDKWEYCGEKDENGRVILNIGFYIIKNNNDQRTFMAIGQEYNLISYSELMNQDFLSIIWLKRKYTFE